MKVRGAPLFALVIAAVHAILAFVYAGSTPYRTPGVLMIQRQAPIADIGAPDERQHANYVQTLLNGEGFPVLKPGRPDAGEHIEDHQPPLYYVLTAGAAKVLGVSDVDDQSASRLRWLNVLIGSATVLGVFYLGLWGLGRADVALGAAAITAALPMNCALSGAVSNDPLLFSICTWTLALCAKAMRQGWSIGLAVGVGALTGFGILTKTTAVGLLPILLLAVLLPQKKRPSWQMIGLAALSVALIAGPWLVRNQNVYGDPLAMGAFREQFTGTAQAKDMIAGLGAATYWTDFVAWWTGRSFFGVFGYMDIWLTESGGPYGATETRPGPPNTVYRLLIGISLALVLAWIGSFFKADWKESRSVQILNAAFLVIVVLLFVMFNMTYFQGQGRYLYPAIGPIAIAMSAGCFVLLKEGGKVAVAVLAGILLLVNVYAIAKLPSEFDKRRASQLGIRTTFDIDDFC